MVNITDSVYVLPSTLGLAGTQNSAPFTAHHHQPLSWVLHHLPADMALSYAGVQQWPACRGGGRLSPTLNRRVVGRCLAFRCAGMVFKWSHIRSMTSHHPMDGGGCGAVELFWNKHASRHVCGCINTATRLCLPSTLAVYCHHLAELCDIAPALSPRRECMVVLVVLGEGGHLRGV